MSTQHKIKRILTLLDKAYGAPRAFRKSNPVDELVRTILSQNTNDKNSLAAFAVLKKRFRTWNGLIGTDTKKIVYLIKHAGLANIKANRIKEVLKEIKRREGKIDLASLARLDDDKALRYLMSFGGVGPKTAACVLLFSFGKGVMPVDTHIFRVTKRLGLIDNDLSIEEAHRALTKIVPKGLIYDFHLGIIMHGRKTCKSQAPRCGVCAVYGLCRFKDKLSYRKKK
ncbi:MAG: endonuclease III [Candidatus Omnitrophota bacterium]|jgi:endonuclease-3